MKAHLFTALLAFAATTVLAAPAEAAGDAKGLGEKYQLVISADRLVPVFSYTYASSTTPVNNIDATDSESGAGLSLLWGRIAGAGGGYPVNVHAIPRVAFDFTIVPRLSLGLALAFGFGLGGTDKAETVNQGGVKVTRETDAPTATAIGIAPRVGYILPLTDWLAFWPRAGVGLYWVSSKTETRDNNNNTVTERSTTDGLFSIDLDPQLAFTPFEHVFFNVGPLVNIPIGGSRDVKTTTGTTSATTPGDASVFHFGLTAGIGGFITL